MGIITINKYKISSFTGTRRSKTISIVRNCAFYIAVQGEGVEIIKINGD